MALTIRTRVSDGETTLYPVDFDLGYLRQEFVYVYSGEDFTQQLDYTWVNDSQIELNEPVSSGTEFYIRRVVPRNDLINNYEDGSILRENNLDDSYRQALMILQEVEDGFISLEEFRSSVDINIQGNRLLEVAAAISGTDGVNLDQVNQLVAQVLGDVSLDLRNGILTEDELREVIPTENRQSFINLENAGIYYFDNTDTTSEESDTVIVTDSGARLKLLLIQEASETIRDKMERPDTQQSVDRAELMGIISTVVSATTRFRPRVSPIINEKMQRIMGAAYCDHAPSYCRGAANGGIVFGTYDDGFNDPVTPLFMFLAPNTSISGSVTLSITVEPINGSNLDDLTVNWGQWRKQEDGMSQIGVRGVITRSGSTWSLTRNLTGDASVGDLFGIHMSAAPGSGDYEITDAALTDTAGTVYSLTDEMKQETIVNLLGDRANASVIPQTFGKVEIRNHGVKSGHIPAKFFGVPSADDTTGVLSGTAGGTRTAGNTPYNGLTMLQAFLRSEVYYVNGYTVPATMLMHGSYVPHYTAGHIRTLNTGIYNSPSEWFIGCPNGIATLSGNSTSTNGLVFGAVSGSVQPKLYLANIHCDETINRPFASTRFDVDAYNVSAVHSLTEGFETDFCDLTLERGRFSGADNDGINAHGTGHITLIDTDATDNVDDGFSPHDLCTYSVYGGNYRNNGKGNIIPAFGSQGFCTDVVSSGSTGLSPRIADVTGYNDGGLVCLGSNDITEQTVLFATNCTSTGDNNGIVSAGRNSFVLTNNCTIADSVNYDLLSNDWQSTTGQGQAGMLITTYSDTSDNTIEDERNRILNLDRRLLVRN